MSAFDKAWTLLKELSPSARIMQDNAREALENRNSGYFQPNSHRFLGHSELYRPVRPVRPRLNRSQRQILNRFYNNNTQPLDPSTMEYEKEFDRVHGDIE